MQACPRERARGERGLRGTGDRTPAHPSPSPGVSHFPALCPPPAEGGSAGKCRGNVGGGTGGGSMGMEMTFH